jgi:hypothetical protein
VKILGTVVSATVALCVQLVSAATVIDQEYFPPSAFGTGYANVGASGRATWAQTFTVGVTGEMVGLDLGFFKPHTTTQPLLYDIRRTTNGVPSGNPETNDTLVSGSVDAGSIMFQTGNTAPVLHIDFTVPSPLVTSGDVLAVVLQSEEPADANGFSYSWMGFKPGGYTGGQPYFFNSVFGWQSDSHDWSFRTYISIPEPTSNVILLTGLAGALFKIRRRSLLLDGATDLGNEMNLGAAVRVGIST